MESPGTNKTVSRALHVLEVMAQESQPVSLSMLTERTGYPKSSLFKLLHTLLECGFVEKDPRTGLYKLSIKMYEIGSAALSQYETRDIIHFYLDEIAGRTQETATLSVLEDENIVYLGSAESNQFLVVKPFHTVGERVPAYCTSPGKVLLAYLDQDKLDELMRTKFPATIVADDFKTKLADVREMGYALELEEREKGVHSIAVPLKSSARETIAALGVIGPKHRMPKEKMVMEILPVLREVSNKITNKFGFLGKKLLI